MPDPTISLIGGCPSCGWPIGIRHECARRADTGTLLHATSEYETHIGYAFYYQGKKVPPVRLVRSFPLSRRVPDAEP